MKNDLVVSITRKVPPTCFASEHAIQCMLIEAYYTSNHPEGCSLWLLHAMTKGGMSFHYQVTVCRFCDTTKKHAIQVPKILLCSGNIDGNIYSLAVHRPLHLPKSYQCMYRLQPIDHLTLHLITKMWLQPCMQKLATCGFNLQQTIISTMSLYLHD